ncbi:hypothetical protein [Acetobacter pomorum]|nr:hypothetical protein [Acetobacter pomorum]
MSGLILVFAMFGRNIKKQNVLSDQTDHADLGMKEADDYRELDIFHAE